MAFRIMRAKWAIVELAALSSSGYEEIVAIFEYKHQATEWKKIKRLNSRYYRIVKIND